jgi:hypothetical protein
MTDFPITFDSHRQQLDFLDQQIAHLPASEQWHVAWAALAIEHCLRDHGMPATIALFYVATALKAELETAYDRR